MKDLKQIENNLKDKLIVGISYYIKDYKYSKREIKRAMYLGFENDAFVFQLDCGFKDYIKFTDLCRYRIMTPKECGEYKEKVFAYNFINTLKEEMKKYERD